MTTKTAKNLFAELFRLKFTNCVCAKTLYLKIMEFCWNDLRKYDHYLSCKNPVFMNTVFLLKQTLLTLS